MFKATRNLTTSSTVKDAIFMSMEISSCFVVKYRLASGPIYSERLPRCNIFFSQIIETLVGSNVHQQDGRQAVMALSDLRVFVAAVGEKRFTRSLITSTSIVFRAFIWDQSTSPQETCKGFFDLFYLFLQGKSFGTPDQISRGTLYYGGLGSGMQAEKTLYSQKSII